MSFKRTQKYQNPVNCIMQSILHKIKITHMNKQTSMTYNLKTKQLIQNISNPRDEINSKEL